MATTTSASIAISIPSDDPFVMSFLDKISEGKRIVTFQKGDTVFSQGDGADSIYFVQTGKVKISVLSPAGREAVLSMRGPGDICGEECLIAHSLRTSTAFALESSTLFRIEKRAMLRALYIPGVLSTKFIEMLLKRSVDLKEDLCDQLINDSEKRLARVLLKLAQQSENAGLPEVAIPRLSHEVLSEMVGTTRSRVSYFMNKFRNMKLIEYGDAVSDEGFGLIVRVERLADAILQNPRVRNDEHRRLISKC